ncbi:AAA family ATPase [Devosia sediminis]|uniref:AAA family ATPase n=1 Tax=Devosia sediminis TaxID=2798801 RepID=A0A934IV68_9HYPH|nr:AAA family ATPase [Devosia sediminis]MBJ3785721.1 AAA family ATPase [Devosia sediminis]
MFILLNGSFGIGKTTTARLLARDLTGTAISDPEHLGYVLRRLPPLLLGLREQPGDYQDMALWRRLIVYQARLVHLRAKLVIVPMAFTNLTYLDAFAGALERTASVKRICLVAPLEVIHARLEQRAMAEGRAGLTPFEIRRSAECVAAHADPAFGDKVDAQGSPENVVALVKAVIE